MKFSFGHPSLQQGIRKLQIELKSGSTYRMRLIADIEKAFFRRGERCMHTYIHTYIEEVLFRQ